MMHRLRDVHCTGLLACALLGVLLPAAALALAPRLEVDTRIRQDDGQVVQRSVAPGAVLHSGDDVRVRVTAWADGYLYVVVLGSSGSAVVLHPFTGPAEPVRAGEELAVPRDGGFLPLDARTGRESVLAFVAPEPVESLTRLLVRLEAAGPAADGATLREVLASEGFEAAHLAFGHAPAAVDDAPMTIASAAADAPAGSPQPSAPAAGGTETPGVLSGLGSRIAQFTGEARAGAAGAPQSPPPAAATEPVRAPAPAPAAQKPSGGFLASLFGGGGSEPAEAPEREPEPPPPASTFPLGTGTPTQAEPVVLSREAVTTEPAPVSRGDDTAVAAGSLSPAVTAPEAPSEVIAESTVAPASASPPALREVPPPPAIVTADAVQTSAVDRAAPEPGPEQPETEPVPAGAPESGSGGILAGLSGLFGVRSSTDAAAGPAAESTAQAPQSVAAAAPQPAPRDPEPVPVGSGDAPAAASAPPMPADTPSPAASAVVGAEPALPAVVDGSADSAGAAGAAGAGRAQQQDTEGRSGGWLAALFGGSGSEATPDQGAVEPAPAAASDSSPPASAGAVPEAPADTAPATADDSPATTPPDESPDASPGLLASLGALFSGGSRDQGPAQPQAEPPAAAGTRVEASRVNTGTEPTLTRRVDESGRSVVALEGAPPPRQGNQDVLAGSGSRIRALLDEPEPPRPAAVEAPSPDAAAQVAAVRPAAPTSAPTAAPDAPSTADPQDSPAISAPRTPAVSDPPPDPVRSALASGAAAAGSEPPAQVALLTAAPARAAVQAAERLAQVDLSSNTGAAGAVVMVVTPQGATSGVLVDSAGLVLTNWHSVRGYDAVLVLFKQAGGTGPAAATRSRARLVGHSKFSDLALLQVDTLPSGIAPPALVSQVEVDGGSPLHAISPGVDGQWRHSVATVDRIRRNSSWYSTSRVLHRADVIRAEMSDPQDVSGAPLFNNALELVGLGAMVRTDKRELIGISAGTVRTFLDAPG